MKPKIIYIISFVPKYEYYQNKPIPGEKWLTRDGKEVTLAYGEWAHMIGNLILKYSDAFCYEVWRPDYRADQVFVHTFENGMVHKTFPATIDSYLFGLKIWKDTYSKEMMDLLEKETALNPNLILEIPADYNYIGEEILKKFKRRVLVVSHTRLSFDLYLKYPEPTYSPLKWLHRILSKKRKLSYLKRLQNIVIAEQYSEAAKRLTRAKIFKRKYAMLKDFDLDYKSISKSEARNKLNLPIHKRILFLSSRLDSVKQIDKLIEVLSRLNQYEFLCVISGHGETEYVEYLTSLVRKLSMDDKFLFTGFLREELFDYYRACDLFISTSVFEGGPNSVFKAIQAGVPIFSTDTGFGAQLLKDFKAGIVVPTTGYGAWHDALKQFFEGSPVDVVNVEEFNKKYNESSTAHALINVYKAALNGKKSQGVYES